SPKRPTLPFRSRLPFSLPITWVRLSPHPTGTSPPVPAQRLKRMDPNIMPFPIDDLCQTLRRNGVARFMEHFQSLFPDTHMKDLVVEAAGPGREVEILGRRVIN